jgi:hypothetical protein
MMIPSMVKIDLSLFALRLPKETRMLSKKFIARPSPRRNAQTQERQHDGDDKSLEINLTRLTAQLRLYICFVDPFNAVIPIARPARSQRYSGFVARLEIANARPGER